MKICLKKNSAIDFEGNYKYSDKTLNYILKNKLEIEKLDFVQKKLGIFSEFKYEKKFSLSGSYIVKTLDELGFSKKFFIEKEGRYFVKGINNQFEFHLRGPRYVLALDPHYSVIQKVDLLNEDINDAVKYLYQLNNYNCKQYNEISPILDYLKNALITLFNAFIHKEKQLNFELENNQYQNDRKLLLSFLQESTLCYYLSLVNKLNPYDINELLLQFENGALNSIISKIKFEFRGFSFSSKSVVRPEASHPLVLLGYSFKMAKKFKHYDYIFGLPSGSTELSCLIHKLIMNHFKSQNNVLYLIPISFHSNNIVIDNSQYEKVLDILPKGNEQKFGLIVDDNSATGITIEQTIKLIQKNNPKTFITCSVAEADLIRINLNLNDTEKDYTYSSPDLFKYCVGVLPISKIIKKKYDLKEVIESRQLFNYYKSKKAENLIKKIKYEIIADSIENKIESKVNSFNNENSIFSFKHTFLSNFYGVPIVYQKRFYSSVEQAYLRQKFDSNELSKLNSKQKKELNEILIMKGIIIQLNNFKDAFDDFNYPSGVLKRFSNKLKEWGLEDKKWDEKRLDIMIELLIQKFSTEIFMNKLLDTNDKYLIEGNTWNDTFWGVCNGKGKNYLGRILMNIREKIRTGEISKNNS